MTGVRISLKWAGEPASDLKARAEKAIQKGARSTGCFGSAELLAAGPGVKVTAARVVSAQDPSNSPMKNSIEVVSRWLRIGAIPAATE